MVGFGWLKIALVFCTAFAPASGAFARPIGSSYAQGGTAQIVVLDVGDGAAAISVDQALALASLEADGDVAYGELSEADRQLLKVAIICVTAIIIVAIIV